MSENIILIKKKSCMQSSMQVLTQTPFTPKVHKNRNKHSDFISASMLDNSILAFNLWHLDVHCETNKYFGPFE